MRLVKVVYRKSTYMNDDYKIIEKYFTVDATRDAEAEQKVLDHFEELDDLYGTEYYVMECDVVEHIN